jgi:hypothetical protein
MHGDVCDTVQEPPGPQTEYQNYRHILTESSWNIDLVHVEHSTSPSPSAINDPSLCSMNHNLTGQPEQRHRSCGCYSSVVENCQVRATILKFGFGGVPIT